MTPMAGAEYPVTRAVARRELEFQNAEGARVRVVVRLGQPRRDPAHPGDWVCPYDIHGFSKPYRRWASGIDSMQALALAYHIIPTELGALAQREGGGTVLFLGAAGTGYGEDGCRLVLDQGDTVGAVE